MVDMHYTLLIPFRISEEREILIEGEQFNRQNGELEISLHKKSKNIYVAEIKGFETAVAAKEYLKRFWVGLTWVMLNSEFPFSISLEIDEVAYSENPEETAKNIYGNLGLSIERIDGFIREGYPSIYPSDRVIRTVGGSADFSIRAPVEIFYQKIMEGVQGFDPVDIFNNPKLKIALELFNSHYFEYSREAKFLTLIMALEVLTASTPKHDNALQFIKKWIEEIEAEKIRIKEEKNLEDSLEIIESLDSLKQQLNFHKSKKGLRSQIRELVYNTLAEWDESNAEDYSKKAVYLYDKRSKLVHEGRLSESELRICLSDAKKIAKLILEKKLMRLKPKSLSPDQ